MKNYLVIHHSGGGPKETIQIVRNLHKPKYGRTYYNIVIDRNSKIWREHDEWNYRGQDKRSKDVCVLGNFLREEPTEKQLHALSAMIHVTKGTYGLEGPIAHKNALRRGLVATKSTCPGNLMNYLNIMKNYKIQYIFLGPGNYSIPHQYLVDYYKGVVGFERLPDIHIDAKPDFMRLRGMDGEWGVNNIWITNNLKDKVSPEADLIYIWVADEYYPDETQNVRGLMHRPFKLNGAEVIDSVYDEISSFGIAGKDFGSREYLLIHEVSHALYDLVLQNTELAIRQDKTHEYNPDYIRGIRELLQLNDKDMKLIQKKSEKQVWLVLKDGRRFWILDPKTRDSFGLKVEEGNPYQYRYVGALGFFQTDEPNI